MYSVTFQVSPSRPMQQSIVVAIILENVVFHIRLWESNCCPGKAHKEGSVPSTEMPAQEEIDKE